MAGYHIKVGKPEYSKNDPLKRRIERGLYRLLAEPEKRKRRNKDGTPKNEAVMKLDKSVRDELRQNLELAMRYLVVKNRWDKKDEKKPKQPPWGTGFNNGAKQEEDDDGLDDPST